MSFNNVKFRCPHCGKISEGPAQYIGTEDNCPFCGRRFRLTATGDVPTSTPNCLMCYFGMFEQYFGFRGRTRRREFWWAACRAGALSADLELIEEAIRRRVPERYLKLNLKALRLDV